MVERDFKGLDRAFNPRTVVVVGDKQAGGNYMWLRSMSTFKGKVYSVQIDPKELPGIQALGFPNYSSLLDIKEPVDYVVVAVPRQVSPRIIADCIKKNVGGVSLFTSGFAETDTPEGIQLQATVGQMARQAGLNLIGPNCMGVFNPKLGVRNSTDQYSGESGPVAFISQSGTHCIFFSVVGAQNGFHLSKAVSYGNAVVLDSPDYLEYFAQDEETRIIAMYIEGVKNGRRFFNVLREVTPDKPVIIWKGGQTHEGARAASSHTASLAQSWAIWDAVIRQCGALRADSLDEAVDITKALLYLKPTTGLRVGLMAMTGGQSVVVTDAFARAGLQVPVLARETYEQFAPFFNIVGGSYRNPLDVSSNFQSVELVMRMLGLLAQDPHVDSVAMELAAPFLSRRQGPLFLEGLLSALADFKGRCPKPFLVIITSGNRESEALELRARLLEKGLPCFLGFERGARALKRVVEYYRFRSGVD